jgi:WD40 repeat protein
MGAIIGFDFKGQKKSPLVIKFILFCGIEIYQLKLMNKISFLTLICINSLISTISKGQYNLDQTLGQHKQDVWTAIYSPDGKFILTASADKTAKLWSLDSNNTDIELSNHTGQVNTASFSSDSKKIVTSSDDGTVKVWNISGEELFSIKNPNLVRGQQAKFNSAYFSPDGSKILTSSNDANVCLWNAKNGNIIKCKKDHADIIWSATFSVDGKYIASASDDGSINIYNGDNLGLKQTISTGKKQRIWYAAFSKSGSKVGVTFRDKTSKIYETKTGKLLTNLIGHQMDVNWIDFSNDEKNAVTCSDDKTVIVWDIISGKMIQKLEGHTNWVNSVEYSPYEDNIITSSSDRTIRIWKNEK